MATTLLELALSYSYAYFMLLFKKVLISKAQKT